MTGVEMLREFSKEIYGYEFSEIIKKFSRIFVVQCGNIQFADVQKRISNSSTFNRLNASSKMNRTWVNDKSIIGPLLTIPHFLFKGGYVQYLASLFALEKWHNEVNKVTNVQTEREVADVAISMFLYIDKTRGFKV